MHVFSSFFVVEYMLFVRLALYKVSITARNVLRVVHRKRGEMQ
jgi:hypothetical protein